MSTVKSGSLLVAALQLPALDMAAGVQYYKDKLGFSLLLFEEFTARGATVQEPLTDRPWGMRQFALLDLSGNALRFGEPIGAGGGNNG